MPLDIKTLREEFDGLYNANARLIETVGAEKRGFTGEEKEKKDKFQSRMIEITELIQAETESAKIAAAAKFDAIKPAIESRRGAPDESQFTSEKEHKDAIKQFFRGGCVDPRLAQKFDNGIISTGGSSIALAKKILPPVYVKTLPNYVYALLEATGFGGNVINTGQDHSAFMLPNPDDSSNVGAAKAEDATSETSATTTTMQGLDLTGTQYESKPQWVSRVALTANGGGWSWESYIPTQLQSRIFRGLDAIWWAVHKAGTAGKTTTTSATAFTYLEWMDFEFSLDAAYRSTAGIVCADSVVKQLLTLTDGSSAGVGNPLIDRTLSQSGLMNVHGMPIKVSGNVDAIASAKVVAAIIDCSSMFVRETDYILERYENYPGKSGQIGFNLLQSVKLGNFTGTFKTLVMKT